MTTLTHERLLEMLHYDPVTGMFTRRVTVGSFKVGEVAGSLDRQRGYIRLTIDGTSYHAHRIAWFYVHGKWPLHDVDHRDTIKHHNWIDNLRDVSDRVNQENIRRARPDNRSGLLGVCLRPGNLRPTASIQVCGKRMHLGVFDTPDLAHAAYVAAKRELHEGCTI